MKKKLYFFIYIILILKITVFRSGFSFDRIFIGGTLNLIPFTDLGRIYQQYGIFRFIYLFAGNIICFLPFGFLLPQIMQKYSFKIVIYGFLFSFLIESMQFIWGTGVSEIDDLMLNTFGVWIGYQIARNFQYKNKKNQH